MVYLSYIVHVVDELLNNCCICLIESLVRLLKRTVEGAVVGCNLHVLVEVFMFSLQMHFYLVAAAQRAKHENAPRS